MQDCGLDIERHRLPVQVVEVPVAWVQDCGLDIEGFRRWAAGNLVDNRNRGIFAEWLVGQALGAIDAGEFRQEWEVWDLQYRHASIEVKASGLNQYWSPLRRSKPSFGITVPKQIYCEQTKKPQANLQGTRPADVYVFCLHTSLPATNANVACPYTWEFWVIAGRTLDDKLGAQKPCDPQGWTASLNASYGTGSRK